MDNPSLKHNFPLILAGHSPLGNHSKITDGASLVEITTQSIVSVSPFKIAETAFKASIMQLFNSGPPNAKTAFERDGKKACILLPSAHSQWFLCFDNDGTDPVYAACALLGKKLSNQLALTDQSDSWVVLALTGPLVRRTLERICPIDCGASAMPVGTTVRTIVNHLGAIIVRRDDHSDDSPSFWLFSARSSANSFLSAILASPPFSE